ncbi:hypothetical protein P3L10_030509 [Capsicum annuum]
MASVERICATIIVFHVVCIKMNQQGPLKTNKRTRNGTFNKPGSLSSMENRKRYLLTTNKIVQAIRSEKENLLKLIEQEHPPVAPLVPPSREIKQIIVEHHAQDEQHVEDQVQIMIDLATPTTVEHCKQQDEGPSTRKTRGKTKCTS